MYQDYYKELLSRVSRRQFFCIDNIIFLVHALQYGKQDKHYTKIIKYQQILLEYPIYKILSQSFLPDDLFIMYTKNSINK